jgi:hypothetical protein
MIYYMPVAEKYGILFDEKVKGKFPPLIQDRIFPFDSSAIAYMEGWRFHICSEEDVRKIHDMFQQRIG